MARESMRKRFDRRYGKPERLADRIAVPGWDDWKMPAYYTDIPSQFEVLRTVCTDLRKIIETAVLIEATNVSTYFYEIDTKDQSDIEEDFPACFPPFRNFFIEMARPSKIVIGTKVMPCPRHFDRIGWLFRTTEVAEDAPLLKGDKIRFVMVADCFIELDGKLCGPLLTANLAVKPDGAICGDWCFAAYTPLNSESKAMMEQCVPHFTTFLHPALLAISFMNCKNVAMSPVEPDVKLNGIREKAGMKPFLRYHTLEIEGMKEVLRTEGGVETNGIVRALHLVRGHIVHRMVPNPITYWRSPHVRGHSPAGIVVKDYRVNPPRA